MLRKSLSVLVITAALACSFFVAFDFTGAANSPGLALTGRVTSTEEGAMEGVLVSAKKVGSTITFTVVSNQEGRYQFPAAKLDPGPYSLTIRAPGYDFDGNATTEVTPQRTATVDLK
ncbi:MAG TPA: carboxypeptidase-like regulatory domain-containing protein, partial [Candidatus Binatia bacterium]|nr:carboxypeptidase-like regulatory domain-containing protein [Candidatus Binatia bacterium]